MITAGVRPCRHLLDPGPLLSRNGAEEKHARRIRPDDALVSRTLLALGPKAASTAAPEPDAARRIGPIPTAPAHWRGRDGRGLARRPARPFQRPVAIKVIRAGHGQRRRAGALRVRAPGPRADRPSHTSPGFSTRGATRKADRTSSSNTCPGGPSPRTATPHRLHRPAAGPILPSLRGGAARPPEGRSSTATSSRRTSSSPRTDGSRS